MYRLLFVIFLCISPNLGAQLHVPQKTCYQFLPEPIDVVIPCCGKDLETLEACIEGIKKNGKNCRRIIVVSDKPYTPSAEWFDESRYPFTKFDLALAIFGEKQAATEFLKKPQSRIGWIYQQFLKLYAPFIIPGISSNVLILDADTIFLRPVEFLSSTHAGLMNTGTEYYPPYFDHMSRLIPWLHRLAPRISGISHHMLFQRPILQKLFQTIEHYHNDVVWKSLCKCVDKEEITSKPVSSCMSEYEIYFNFAFSTTDQLRIRLLKWSNINDLRLIPKYAEEGFHYVSCHAHLRAEGAP